jgi:uncharacterized protein YbaR (Trm112 family)
MTDDSFRVPQYRLRQDVSSMSEAYANGNLLFGDIIQSGRVAILRCPACAAIQFTPQAVTGLPEAPNLLKPIHCGAGTCRRCGKWFVIHTGAPRLVDAP